MADIKITALPALAATADVLDVLAIVDVSDNGITASGTTKSVLISELPYLANGSNISLLTNDVGYKTVSDFSNNGEAATANRDLGNTDAFGLSFITSGVGRINILAGGDVGIGVTPTEKFHVLGNIANGLTDLIVTGTVPTTSVPTNSGFYGNSGANVNTFQHVFGIRDNNINGFCIAVENTTPTVEDKIFQVGRTGGNTEVRVMDAVSDAGGGTIVLSTNSGETVFNDAGNDVNFRIGGDTDANLFKIDAGLNNIGIGTSTPTEKLEVAGNAKFSGTTYLNASSVVGQTDNGELSVGSGGNLGFVKKAGANGVLAVGSNDNFVIQKSTNGNLIGTTAASTFTDIYHQENDALIRVGRNSIAFRVDDDNGSIAPSDTTEQFQINTFAATSITVDTLGRTTLGGATADAEVVLNTDDSTAVAAGLKVKNITGVQILALSVPSNGMIVYATATSGAISSVGFWGYEAGAWVKL